MKHKLTLTIIGVIILNFNLKSQDTLTPLPTKGKYIFYKFNDTINSPKNELCHYYCNEMFLSDVNSKIKENSEKFSKIKSNLFNSSYYLETAVYLREVKQIKGSYYREFCNGKNINDTFNGNFYISFVKMPKIYSPLNKKAFQLGTLSVKFKIIFNGDNTYQLTINSFTSVGGETFDFDNTYQEFINEEKKDKNTIKLYNDFNKLINIFHTSLFDALSKNVELDNL